MKEGFVTHKEAFTAIVVALGLLGGFGLWLVNRAEAAGEPAKSELQYIRNKVDDIERYLREGRSVSRDVP